MLSSAVSAVGETRLKRDTQVISDIAISKE